MDTRFSTFSLFAVAMLFGGCASEPPRYGEVVTLRAGQPAPEGYPAPGTVWRLDPNDLKTLSPAPIVPAPPPPQLPPPPRPNDPPGAYYGPPYFAPYGYGAPGFFFGY